MELNQRRLELQEEAATAEAAPEKADFEALAALETTVCIWGLVAVFLWCLGIREHGDRQKLHSSDEHDYYELV